MATCLPQEKIEKFCLEHLVRDSCSKTECTFFHYGRQRVQVIKVMSEEGYVEGRLSYIPLCRFFTKGTCRYGNRCHYRHEKALTLPNDNSGNIASTSTSSDICYNSEQMKNSKNKTCGICFEAVLEKATENERKFGILPNCAHCYCIVCICRWRQSKQFENKIIKACPECRVKSDFVCPSTFWVDTLDDKEKLILNYKKQLSTRDCKHFRKGKGKCPFRNKCFYRHALPDGTIKDVGPPRSRSNRRQRNLDNISTDEVAYLQQIIFWNVLDEDFYGTDDQLWQLAEEFEDFDFSDDDDDSDLSEYDYLID